MDRNNRLKQKYTRLQRSKRLLQEDAVQVNKENGNVPQNNPEVKICGHSTPIRKKNDGCINNIENSPELDYNCSPIICTQDGGNDVAWDWQNIHSKSSNNRKKIQSTVETPKRTKQLQKKRNSNSPLLNKPVKRKLAKVERMESIGKFAAELKALTEKMNNIQKVDDNHLENKTPFEADDIKSELMIDSNAKDTEKNVQNTSTIESDTDTNHISDHNMNTCYADLFDDAADDFMVRCSQEVEARLLELKEKPHLANSPYKSEGKESVINEKDTQHTSIKNISNESMKSTTSKASNKTSNKDSTIASTNISHYNVKELGFGASFIDTVSSNNWSSTTRIENTPQSINNNNINNNVSKQVSSEDMFESFDFPDDSFDACLAICIDDDKLLSKLNEHTNILPNENSTKSSCDRFHKNLIIASQDWKAKKGPVLKNTIQIESKGSKVDNAKIGNSSSQLVVDNFGKTNAFFNSRNNEKLFQRRSLSDSCFEQSNKNVDMCGRSSVPAESKKSITSCTLVSASALPTEQIVKNGNKVSMLLNNVDTYKTQDANKLEQRKGCKLIVRHNSDSSFNNSTKKIQSSSQPQQCTPAEIERKRQEAKMKLEAKRRLLLNTNSVNTLKVIPSRRQIKR